MPACTRDPRKGEVSESRRDAATYASREPRAAVARLGGSYALRWSKTIAGVRSMDVKRYYRRAGRWRARGGSDPPSLCVTEIEAGGYSMRGLNFAETTASRAWLNMGHDARPHSGFGG